MKTEISAGGIIVRKRKTIWEVLVVRDMNDALTFPKGNVEKGELPEAAAKREINEEVGISAVTLVKKLSDIRYMYQRNGLISKTVHYFLFKSIKNEPLKPQKEEGIHDAAWFPLTEAIKLIGYKKSNEPLLTEVKEFLWT